MSQYDEKCKHIAGLLLLWNKSSKEFTILDSWQTLLQNKDKEELLKLIILTAYKSIDTTNALYEELKGEPLIDHDEIYDPEEW